MQTATVRFLPSSSPGIIGYTLSIATVSGGYASGTQIDIPMGAARVAAGGVLEYDVPMSANVPHYLVMRAYSAQTSSGYSNEIVIPAVAAPASSMLAPTAVGGSATPSVSSPVSTSGGSVPASMGGAISTVTSTAPASATSASTSSASTASSAAMSSIDLDGAGEYLGSTGAYALGVSNQFTLSIWALADPQTTDARALISVRGGNQTARNLLELTSDATDLRMTVYNDAGQLVYQAVYAAALVPGSWQHIALTFDAAVDSAPVLLVDGLVRAPSSANLTGNPAVFADSAGRVLVGASGTGSAGTWFGAIGHVAVWGAALGDDEIDEISRRGHSLDLRSNVGAYLASDVLLHYWRLGENPAAVGADSGPAAVPIHLDDPSGHVDATDIVADAPTLLP